MARVVRHSQTLKNSIINRAPSSLLTLILGPACLLHLRRRSSRPGKPQSVDIALSGSSSDSDSASAYRLEETLLNFAIHRSAPDWLPFRPGTSFFVPPVDPSFFSQIKIVQLLGRIEEEEEDDDEEEEEDDDVALTVIFGARD